MDTLTPYLATVHGCQESAIACNQAPGPDTVPKQMWSTSTQHERTLDIQFSKPLGAWDVLLDEPSTLVDAGLLVQGAGNGSDMQHQPDISSSLGSRSSCGSVVATSQQAAALFTGRLQVGSNLLPLGVGQPGVGISAPDMYVPTYGGPNPALVHMSGPLALVTQGVASGAGPESLSSWNALRTAAAAAAGGHQSPGTTGKLVPLEALFPCGSTVGVISSAAKTIYPAASRGAADAALATGGCIQGMLGAPHMPVPSLGARDMSNSGNSVDKWSHCSYTQKLQDAGVVVPDDMALTHRLRRPPRKQEQQGRVPEADLSRGPQNSLKQIIQAMVALLYPRAKVLHRILRMMYGDDLPRHACQAFLHVVLGPPNKIWPLQDGVKLNSKEVVLYLARLLSWLGDKLVEPQEVNMIFNKDKNSYKVDHVMLKDKGLFPWMYKFPLQPAVQMPPPDSNNNLATNKELSHADEDDSEQAVLAAVQLYDNTSGKPALLAAAIAAVRAEQAAIGEGLLGSRRKKSLKLAYQEAASRNGGLLHGQNAKVAAKRQRVQS